MDKAHLLKIIEQGENILVEFKKCQTQFSKDVFESVCVFLNRTGGHLFLGVEDSGKISRQVLFENANRPQGHGLIDPKVFTPFPKNPIIARVFKEIGFADELGSGVRNLFKYTPLFSNGANPQLIEDDIFKILIPVTGQDTAQVAAQVTAQVTAQVIEQDTEQDILNYCKIPRSSKEIMKYLNLKHREHFRLKMLKPLIKRKMLLMTIPDKPNSSKQKYYSNINKSQPE